jgi:hypothetical protein
VDRVANRADRRARLAVARSVKNQWQWESRPEAASVINRSMQGWGVCFGAHLTPVYSCQLYRRQTEWGEVTHIAIRRHDGGTSIPWADKQRIKDDLVGPERLAIEVFPPRDELDDAANMYHLWVLPAGFELPFRLEAHRG